MFPQAYECKESDHTWARIGKIAIAVPELDAKIRHYETEQCTTCGAIRRARRPDGNPVEDDDGEPVYEA